MRALVMAALAMAVGMAQANELREWTSKDGTAKLTARFHRQEGDKVTVILPNGRSQVIATSFLSDADLAWIAAQSSAEAAKNDEFADAPIPAALKGNLVDAKGNPVDLAAGGRTPRYFLFYYSASWCPPCRAYTPEVVRFAKRLKSADFTVVLVPNDRSREDALAYLKDYDMPWPGIDYGARVRIPGNPGGGIPAARLTDANGRTLLTTEEVSRDDFLDEVRKILSREGALAKGS